MQNKIPELRFPELLGDWETRKVNEFLSRITKPVDVHYDNTYQEIGIRSHGKGIFYKEKTTGKKIGNKRVFWIVENAFIVNIVFAWEHAVSMTTEKEVGMIASHRFPMYLPVSNQASVDYLLHFFLTKKGKWLLELASPGGAGRNKTLGQQEFLKLSFPIPRIEEQQKIASFFTTIDKKILQLKDKKTLLELYKKGVIQRIFSQEIRFKNENGQEFPKWEMKKLKEVVRIMYGKDQKQVKCENGKYPILGTGGEMGRTNDYLCDKPSVLIGRKGTIDKPQYMDTPFWTVDTLFYTEVFDKTVAKWLFYKFETINWRKYNEASGVPSLSASTIYSIPLYLPSVSEQVRISDFLTEIDNKISHTQTQIEKAEKWKKGLLQKMFV